MSQPTFNPEIVEALLLRGLSDDETLFADSLAGMVWRRIVAREPQLETTTPEIINVEKVPIAAPNSPARRQEYKAPTNHTL